METFISIYQKKINTLLVLFTVFLSVVVVFFIFQTLNTIEEGKYIGSGVPPQATIAVSGKGSVLAVPDVAEFSFSVQYEAKEVPDAQREVAERMDKIVSFLKEEGVEERHIKTVGYSTYPRYEWRSSDRPEFSSDLGRERVLVGYEVVHTTKVTVKEMDEAGRLVGGVGSRGATDISGIAFSVEDERSLEREARSEAIKDAENEAKRLANDLGVSIVRIVEFNEAFVQPPYFSRSEMAMDSAGAKDLDLSFEAGEEEIVSEVKIRYEVK